MITSLVLSVTWGTSFTSSLARNWKSANSWTNEERKKRSQQRCNFWTPSTQRRGDLKTVVFSLWKGIRSFPSSLRWSVDGRPNRRRGCVFIFPGVDWCGRGLGMYIKEEIINKPNCFSEEGCLCAARENIPILKKSYKMTFLLHANNTCIAASSLIFVAEWLGWVPLFVACPGVPWTLLSLALLSLIFTNPFSVFSKDDLRKSMLSLTRATLFESPGGRNSTKEKK